jgi:hypothetical protein
LILTISTKELDMQISRIVACAALFVAFPVLATQHARGQITNAIQATFSHPFVVGTTTLPPGKYDFNMLSGSDLTAMTVTSADGKTSTEFLVRASRANHTPAHSELVFIRYGDTEFLHKIYEGGARTGVSVGDESRKEARMKKTQQGAEHTEIQK